MTKLFIVLLLFLCVPIPQDMGPAQTGVLQQAITQTIGNLPTVTSNGGVPRGYLMISDFSQAGYVTSISTQFYTAPVAGTAYTILVATDNGNGNYTITSEPGTLTFAANTNLQTFTTANGLPTIHVAAGQTVGVLVPSDGSGIGYNSHGTANYWNAPENGLDITTGVATQFTSPASGTELSFQAVETVTP